MAKKKQSNHSKESTTHYIDLLYMSPREVKAKDIANLLNTNENITVELWDEMNVLEIELSNEHSVDFEPLDIHFKDPSDAAFIKNQSIHTVFAVSLVKEDLDLIHSFFESIIGQFSGFLCADNNDFHPVYVGSLTNIADHSEL